MALSTAKIHIVGIGGTLRASSTSRSALALALRAAEAAGATTELLALNDLQLPMLVPGRTLADYDDSVARYIEAVRRADGLIWSTGSYHNTLAGVTKNALDLLELLSDDPRPYLHQRVVGLIATAAGAQAAVNALNALTHTAYGLRATVVPLMAPIPNASRVFDPQGKLLDESWSGRLDQLGRLVVETASLFQATAISAD